MRATSALAPVNRASWGTLVTTAAVGMVGIMVWHGHTTADAHHHALPTTGGLHEAVDTAALMASMMLPLAASSSALIAERSLRHRRPLAVAEHALGFAAVWFLFVLCLAPLKHPVSAAVTPAGAFTGACIVATAWQLSNRRSQYVDRCGRVRAAPPLGWRADLGSFLGGGYEATNCVRTCWAAMLTMILAPGMAVMGLVWLAHMWEWSPRRNPFARERNRTTAAFYAALALLLLTALLVPG